ncbi:hypothetical protein M430DRAFT_242065 [Amorphotheca resinae ATCC 22711]|uniref:Uncharacterized protein n=1 Tax=Amorphotheca resinae ATCC 22711 TaxID=857342 RepID=A0A2T3B258_AMORE|nr:hypothetical protein M430DRAFT_242065 [Amorphotheca resinae ATCC 22711]PSS18637.1 hypothetical protein M430DRAFT_242065 [Amorphotheca resinae ATCC 22711]
MNIPHSCDLSGGQQLPCKSRPIHVPEAFDRRECLRARVKVRGRAARTTSPTVDRTKSDPAIELAAAKESSFFSLVSSDSDNPRPPRFHQQLSSVAPTSSLFSSLSSLSSPLSSSPLADLRPSPPSSPLLLRVLPPSPSPSPSPSSSHLCPIPPHHAPPPSSPQQTLSTSLPPTPPDKGVFSDRP